MMCRPSPPVLRSFFVSLIEEPLLLIQLPLTARWLLQPPLSQTISDKPKKKEDCDATEVNRYESAN